MYTHRYLNRVRVKIDADEIISSTQSAGLDSTSLMENICGSTVKTTNPSASVLCLSDESLRVCVHPGPSCCTSKMEDSYMAAVRSETQQKIRSYSFELKYLIAGQTKAFRGEGEEGKEGRPDCSGGRTKKTTLESGKIELRLFLHSY